MHPHPLYTFGQQSILQQFCFLAHASEMYLFCRLNWMASQLLLTISCCLTPDFCLPLPSDAHFSSVQQRQCAQCTRSCTKQFITPTMATQTPAPFCPVTQKQSRPSFPSSDPRLMPQLFIMFCPFYCSKYKATATVR